MGQAVGQSDQTLFLRQNVGGHAAVALPALCPAVGGFAGDVIAAPAVVAQAAAGNVVDDHPVPLVETPEPLALLTMTPQGLMACDGAGNVALRPLAHVFPVDTPDVAPADCGGLGLNQHLAVAGFGNLKIRSSTVLFPGRTAPFMLLFPSILTTSPQITYRF